ncbi:TPA: DUF4038 domain-containing protein [Candidatus Woesearchaeota archaeon]|nr:DUF4038 domain-containing protein [Candidatus Woesearchaeota archaeon]
MEANDKILASAGLIAFFAVVFMFFSVSVFDDGVTGGVVSSCPSFASDSDASFFVKGSSIVSGCSPAFVSDFCVNPCVVGEYVNSNLIQFNCSFGCVDGACLQEGVNPSLTEYCANKVGGGKCDNPEVCNDGKDNDCDALVDECSLCGCPTGQVCQADGTCSIVINEVYFKFDYPPRPETFIFKLTDPAKIQEARDILAGKQTDVTGVMGYIFNGTMDYNSQWSYYLDPDSIVFFQLVMELCDGGMSWLENHFDEYCAQYSVGQCTWCPWGSRLIEEVENPWCIPEVCGDNKDNDCDELVDCEDTDCVDSCENTTDVGLYTVYEQSFTHSGTYANPYYYVTADANVTTPSGKKLTVPMFWDGETTWKFRIAPTEVGTYTYITKSADAGLNAKTGSFTASNTGNKGFIIRDPSNNYAFKYSGTGEHVFLMGDTCWNCFSNVGGNLTHDIFRQYIDKRASQKFNFIRSYIVPIYQDLPNPVSQAQHINEGGVAFLLWDRDKVNPEYFKQVDERIKYANSQGITMHLLVGSDKDNLVKFFGWDNNNYQKMERYVRYLAARYDAYNVNWEGRAEIEEQGSTTPGYLVLGNSIGNWIEKYGVHNHLQSMHTLDSTAWNRNNPSDTEFANENWLDWQMQQAGVPHATKEYGYQWNWITRDRASGKPVMNEEFFYENSGRGATHEHHVDADTVRKATWQVMMHGASGFAFGNTGTYNARTQPFASVQYATSPGAKYMTYLYNFFQDKEYWKLVPTACASDSCIVNPNTEYIAYSETETQLSVSLGSGTYSARFYNPRTGVYNSATTVEGCALRTFTKPDSNDWVLHLKQTATGTPCPEIPVDVIINDTLLGITKGVKVGGTLTSEGYRPGLGENHILYDVPRQVYNGYVEFEVKGFDYSYFPVPPNASISSESSTFVAMYDGRGIPEPIEYNPNYRNNYFRFEVVYRGPIYTVPGQFQTGDAFKGKILLASPTTSQTLNNGKAVFAMDSEGGAAADWKNEPTGIKTAWDPNRWYKIKVVWDNDNKDFKVYRDGQEVWDMKKDRGQPFAGDKYPSTSPYPWYPVDFKIWLGSGPGSTYDNDMPNIVYRNFRLVSYD